MQKQSPVSIVDNEEATGLYMCTACGHPLFEAASRFEAGCGFPSFFTHKKDGVRYNPLSTYGRHRIQLLCNRCGQHLGHLFHSNNTPTGLRYCIHKDAIRLAALEPDSLTSSKPTMPSTEEILHTIREQRSSEANFNSLLQQLDNAIAGAQKENNPSLLNELQDVKETYATAYQKAKENGSAWPEFEKFVTQFERSLISEK